MAPDAYDREASHDAPEDPLGKPMGSGLPWQLHSYAQYCIRSDWTNEAKGDREWAEALALAIDKFAKDWIADNCPGRREGK